MPAKKSDRVGVLSVQRCKWIPGGYAIETKEGKAYCENYNLLRCALGDSDLEYLLNEEFPSDESGCFSILRSEWMEILNEDPGGYYYDEDEEDD